MRACVAGADASIYRFSLSIPPHQQPNTPFSHTFRYTHNIQACRVRVPAFACARVLFACFSFGEYLALTLPEKHLSKAGQPQPESNLEAAEYRGVEHPAHTKWPSCANSTVLDGDCPQCCIEKMQRSGADNSTTADLADLRVKLVQGT